MTPLITTTILDGLLIVLLGVTIGYCLKLNKRIRILQDSKSELAHLIQRFELSTQQATASIAEIHKASKKINDNIQARLDKANYLADDLAFMIEKGTKIADRMEGNISTNRRQAGEAAASVPSRRGARAVSEAESGNSEMPSRRGGAAVRQEASAKNANNQKGMESMMEKLAEMKNAKMTDKGKGKTVGARLRSKSEQELYDALKTEH